MALCRPHSALPITKVPLELFSRPNNLAKWRAAYARGFDGLIEKGALAQRGYKKARWLLSAEVRRVSKAERSKNAGAAV